MQQIIEDIDPWKYKVFSPNECPANILDELRFGAYFNLFSIQGSELNSYPKTYIEREARSPIAEQILNKANLYNKQLIFPELQCGNDKLQLLSRVLDATNNISAVFYKTTIPKGLISITDSEESINYWQTTYANIHNTYIKESLFRSSNEIPLISVPLVYYDTVDKLIYNRVHKLSAGDISIIPTYQSRVDGGVLVVKALDDCIIPLGCGRVNMEIEIYDMIRNDNRVAERYSQATRGISSRNYSSIEFHDKQYLMNVLSQLPLEIVYDLRTYN